MAIALLLAEDLGPMTTIARSALSGIERPRQVVVQSEDEWKALWTEHAPLRALPPVDLVNTTVLAVFMGSRPTGGYGVEIRRVRQTPEAVVVEYTETGPGTGMLAAQVLTSPCHIVAIPKHTGPFRFDRVDVPARGR